MLWSGAGGGPWSTWPVRPSYTPPWQGQRNWTLEGSYCTGQPAWVQTAEKATKVLAAEWTTQPGLPSAGLVKDTPWPTGSEATAPTARPTIAVSAAAMTGSGPTAAAAAPPLTTVRRWISARTPGRNCSSTG